MATFTKHFETKGLALRQEEIMTFLKNNQNHHIPLTTVKQHDDTFSEV